MSINMPPTAAPGGPTAENVPDRLPPSLQPLEAELRTFHREFFRLLAEGGTNRFAVIRGDQIHGVWDTRRDASQYGHEKFEDGRFLAQKIDPRLLTALIKLFGPVPEAVGDADS